MMQTFFFRKSVIGNDEGQEPLLTADDSTHTAFYNMARITPREGRQQPKKGPFNGLSMALIFSVIVILWLVGAMVFLVTKSDEQQEDTTTDHISPHMLLGDSHTHSKAQRLAELKQGHVVDYYLKKYESPLLIFTCSRGEYLARTLEKVFNTVSHHCNMGCPIVVSQDGTNSGVQEVIEKYKAKFATVDVPLLHLTHEPLKTNLRGPTASYKKLAVHYGWALRHVFSGSYVEIGKSYFDKELYPPPRRVIILEEDIEVAPDFFDYMSAMAPLLDNPKNNLLAASAFNDNGLKGKIKNATRVLRSDFFPGLGWLMNRDIWGELEEKWPDAYWDDWLREPPQRKGRQILRPEISRTFHFGSKGGASMNQFGGKLSEVQLNTDQTVNWRDQDFETLQNPELFNVEYWNLIKNTVQATTVAEAEKLSEDGNVRLGYETMKDFKAKSKLLGIMTDEKAGVPRTAYKGVVETRPNGNHLLFLVPEPFESLENQFMATTS